MLMFETETEEAIKDVKILAELEVCVLYFILTQCYLLQFTPLSECIYV